MNIDSSQHRDRLDALHIFISTGEVSGDLQGSYLAQALHQQAQARGLKLTLSGLGGKRMAATGTQLVGNTTPIGAVGIFEAIPFLIPNLLMQRRAQQFFRQNEVDLTIFLDYMGPNLALGKFLHKHFSSMSTAYYIAPQQWVWAFSDKDTEWLTRIADQIVAVFPEEASYYRRFGAEVHYFGHPLVDQFPEPPSRALARQQLQIPATDTVITLLPASRQQEVARVLPIVLAAAAEIQNKLPQVRFLVPISMAKLRPEIATAVAQAQLNAELIDSGSATAIAAADLVLNKSGTVNLEVALMDVPQVVVYRLNPVTARIGYYLLNAKIPFISPVNLFANKSVVPEFVQWEATPTAIAQASLKLLEDKAARAEVQAGYADMRAQMGEPGVCDRAASHLLDFALSGRQSASPNPV